MPAKNLIPQELGLRHNHWEDSPGEGVGVLGDGKGRRKYWRPVGKAGLGYLLVPLLAPRSSWWGGRLLHVWRSFWLLCDKQMEGMRKETDQETFGLVYLKGGVVALMNCVAVVIDRSGHNPKRIWKLACLFLMSSLPEILIYSMDINSYPNKK